MRGSVLWFLACLSVWAATAVADGWAVPLAAFVLWVIAVCALAAIGMLTGWLSGPSSPGGRSASMSSNDPGASRIASDAAVDVTGWHRPDKDGASSRLPRAPQPDGRPGWYKHLADLGIGYNERWPRAGICSSTTWLLRAGDVLLLRFFPPAAGRAAHHCDFGGPGAAACRPISVRADREMRLPIAETGLYRVGVGESSAGAGDAGAIAVWLQVPEADRISLSNETRIVGGYRYLRRSDGALQVEICDEDQSPLLARVDSIAMTALPCGAMLLFDPDQMPWDVESVPDPVSDWRARWRHQFRWYVQLCRGDVLAMEYVWHDKLLDQRVELGDATGSTGGRLEVTGFVRTPTVFSSDSGRGLESFVCQQDGFHFVELQMFGPPEWRGRPSQDFVAPRLWGLRLQRPSALRDFDLAQAWIEHWHQRLVPVPHAVIARPLVDGEGDDGRDGATST